MRRQRGLREGRVPLGWGAAGPGLARLRARGDPRTRPRRASFARRRPGAVVDGAGGRRSILERGARGGGPACAAHRVRAVARRCGARGRRSACRERVRGRAGGYHGPDGGQPRRPADGPLGRRPSARPPPRAIAAALELVVIDSGVAHRHAGGAYNTRRAECEAAAAALGVGLLRELSVEDLRRVAGLPDALARRVRHVVRENARVEAAVEALAAGDLAAVGRLLDESQASLRDDYEVSCTELDVLVELARGEAGVLGA